MLFDNGPVSASLLLALTLTLASASAGATDEGDGEAESPGLLAPTLTSDPKLGTSVGAIAGYLWRFDPDSFQSMVGAFGSYRASLIILGEQNGRHNSSDQGEDRTQ